MSEVAGICMVKDEADIIAYTVGHMLRQVDWVLVADNGSADGTREILEELPCVVVDDPDPAYFQSRKMSALAQKAAESGAEWVVPFDADEIWLTNAGWTIREALAQCEQTVARAPIYNHMATGEDDLSLGPVERMGWRTKDALGLPKVACRTRLPVTIEAGNHGASYPSGIATELLHLHHFPYRSPEQFVRKARNGAAAYALTDLPRGTGLHWREYGEMIDAGGDEAGEAWFRKHFWIERPRDDAKLIWDPCT